MTLKTPLDDARDVLFFSARELTRAHDARMRTSKSNWAAINNCRHHDRDLQKQALRFAAAFVREIFADDVSQVAGVLDALAEHPSLEYTPHPGTQTP